MMFRPAVAAAQATHIEQDDPSITYSGNWWTNDGSENSGGHAKLTNTKGSRASVSFNGTGINWIGVADAYAGLATVYLDGAKTIVNSYSPISKYQTVLFSASNLAPGLHTLSIEITHERNYAPGTQLGVVGYSTNSLAAGTHTIAIESTGTRDSNAQAAWVWIDAFTVTQ